MTALPPNTPNSNMMHALLVEDDPMIGQSLSRTLADEGIHVDWQRDGLSGEHAIQTKQYALILLDLGLPKRTGMQLLCHLRQQNNRTPLLIITARDEVDDRVAGLEAGADDYVIKPFGRIELMARIHAVLRRTHHHDVSLITNGEITINLQTHTANYRNQSLPLSARELTLLHILTAHPGSVFSREQLESKLYERERVVTPNALDVLIHGLRKKFDVQIIRNVRGIGWMVLKQ